MREKNKAIILLLIILFSCQNKNKILLENKKNVHEKNIKVEIILIEDFNLDNHLDTLEIITKKNKNQEFVIKLFGQKRPLICKSIIFEKEKLYSGNIKNNISIIYKKGTISVIQEYGSSSPEGWYTSYINYNKVSKKITVDSINHSWKNFQATSDADFIKSRKRIINVDIEHFNAETEFLNF